MKVLIADDDPQILRALRITLSAKKYQVLTATDGSEALQAAIDHQPDVYLIDLGMPQLNGIEVIQGIRGWSQAPILVVSGRAGAADKVEALDAGADDYITKPFAINELLARIRAVTRRTPQIEALPVVHFDDVTVDLAARSVVKESAAGRRHIRLTPTEWQVLELLIHNAGKLVTRQTMLTKIWGTEHVEDSGYLRLYISQLRKKIESDPSRPRFILTEPGMGYRLIDTFEPEQSDVPPQLEG